MRVSDLEIGRVLGIPIKVHISWVLIFFFVTWNLATGYLPDVLPGLSLGRYWAMGGVAALLLFGSVLLHELGHSYVALRYRIPISQITLFIFGGVAHMRKEPPSPRAEFLIAIAGPVVSFLLAFLCLGGVTLLEWSAQGVTWRGLTVLGGLLGVVNAQLGVFNLLPGFPLDGGRALRAGLWAWSKDFYRATSRAAMVGIIFGAGLGLLGGVLMVQALSHEGGAGMGSTGVWIVLIGAFLFAAARSSRKQAEMKGALAAVSVRDLMTTAVVSVPPDLPLDEAVNRYFLPFGYSGFPVLEDGQLCGLLTVQHLQSIPNSLWPWRRVGDVMQHIAWQSTIAPDLPALQAMDLMISEGVDHLLVVEDGRLVGLLTRSSLGRFLHLGNPRTAR